MRKEKEKGSTTFKEESPNFFVTGWQGKRGRVPIAPWNRPGRKDLSKGVWMEKKDLRGGADNERKSRCPTSTGDESGGK